MVDRGRAALLLAFAVLVLAGAGLSGCGGDDDECAPSSEHAIEGYEVAEPAVLEIVTDVLVRSAFDVLAAGPAQDGQALDRGTQQLRSALQAEGVDLSTIAVDGFADAVPDPTDRARITLDITRQGSLAGQVALVMEQVRTPVTDAVARLPLPEQDMQEWRDELTRDIRRAVRQALMGDPTYRAGIEATVPDWDGRLESAVSSRDDMADAILAIEGDITTEVQLSVVAACEG